MTEAERLEMKRRAARNILAKIQQGERKRGPTRRAFEPSNSPSFTQGKIFENVPGPEAAGKAGSDPISDTLDSKLGVKAKAPAQETKLIPTYKQLTALAVGEKASDWAIGIKAGKLVILRGDK